MVATAYGTFPPLTLPTETGAVSPLGWTVTYFDDFDSITIDTTAQTCTTSAVYPYGGTVGVGGAVQAAYTMQSIGGDDSNNQAYCNPSNASVAGSILSLTATEDYYGVAGPPYGSVGLWTSSLVQKWGYWECRTQMPNGANGSQDGLWGSFWLTALSGWPQEVDIIEQSVSDGNGVAMNSTLHYLSTNSSAGGMFEGMSLPSGGSSITAYHTYGVMVTPNYIAFFCDGQLMQSTSGIVNPAGGTTKYAVAINGQNSFTGLTGATNTPSQPNEYYFSYEPMSCVVALAIGPGDSGTYATNATFPCSQLVDWIRFSALGPEFMTEITLSIHQP